MDQIHLVDHPIRPADYLEAVEADDHGAVITFAGVVRRTEGDRRLRAIDYQAYASMATGQLERILADAHQEWGPFSAVVVHRTGEVPVGEASVWTAVGTGHREAAYEVSRYLIDQLKLRVPIWKREHLPDSG